jgi:hypothetical protein
MIDRIDRNQDIVSKYLNEEDFGTEVFDYLARRIFDDLNEAG